MQSDLIIRACEARPLKVRVADGAMTCIVWVLYLNVILNRLHLTAHGAFGGWTKGESATLTNLLISSLELAGLTIIALMVWNVYNLGRSTKSSRLSSVPTVGALQLARQYEVSCNQICDWQDARRLIVHHDDAGRLIHVDCVAPADKHAVGIAGAANRLKPRLLAVGSDSVRARAATFCA